MKLYRQRLLSIVEANADGVDLSTVTEAQCFEIAGRIRAAEDLDESCLDGFIAKEGTARRASLTTDQLVILVYVICLGSDDPAPLERLAEVEALPAVLRDRAEHCSKIQRLRVYVTSLREAIEHNGFKVPESMRYDPVALKKLLEIKRLTIERIEQDRQRSFDPPTGASSTSYEYWEPVLEMVCYASHRRPHSDMRAAFKQAFESLEDPAEPLAMVGVLAAVGERFGPLVGVIDRRNHDQLVDRLNRHAERFVGFSDEEVMLPEDERPQFVFSAPEGSYDAHRFISACFTAFDAWLQTRGAGYRYVDMNSESDYYTGFISSMGRSTEVVEGLRSFGFLARLMD